MKKKGKYIIRKISEYHHIIILIFILLIAFNRNLEAVKGISYGYYGYDTDRDLGNVNNLLHGNYGKDLSLSGEYVWYNPLITFIEYTLIKITGLSPVYIVVQSGPFINLLCPILFYIMVSFLFNRTIALASTASFIFFSLGNMNSIYSATYSPWNYAGTFSQSLLYLTIILICKAFTKPGYLIFTLTGLSTGLAFLGHSAPGIILVLIIIYLFLKKFIYSQENDRRTKLLQFFKYGIVFSAAFLIISMPLLYYVLGKYKLHMVNFAPAQWDSTGVEFKFLPHLFKQSLSFSLLFSVVGICYFYYNRNTSGIKREVLNTFLFACIILYIYTNLVSIFRVKYNFILPGIVPSFHFIFYLKAIQSVFFGVGFYYIINGILNYIIKLLNKSNQLSSNLISVLISGTLMMIILFYYPIYSKRGDFYNNQVSRPAGNLAVYHWLIVKTNIDDVVASDETSSLFPVMASGRKLISSNKYMVNPYVPYEERAIENKMMISLLNEGMLTDVSYLLKKYNVKYILLENKNIIHPEILRMKYGDPAFLNEKFSVYKVFN